jgi:sortase (surface protein transpeptidase)
MTFASPVKNGVNTLKCKVCNFVKYEEIHFKQKGDVNLCIPAIEMNAEVVLAECNQKNTDTNDTSCDLNFINADNPLFFGHDINSFGKLYKLTVGDLIYFTMNGKTETYKIVVSEEGKLVNGGIDIEGLTTGARCLDVSKNKTLHFFTCHRTIYRPNGRWIVLAELVD